MVLSRLMIRNICIFIFLGFALKAHSITMVSSKSLFLKNFGFIIWTLKNKDIDKEKVTTCYKSYKNYSIENWLIEIGTTCGNNKALISWLNKNIVEILENLKLTTIISDYMFPKNTKIKLRIVFFSKDSVLNKNFFYLARKYLPIVVAAPVYLNNTKKNQLSFKNLANTIAHEITHLYQHKYLKRKYKKSNEQTIEAIAEIAGTCASLYLGDISLESTSMPSFKQFYKQQLTAEESFELTKYGKNIKTNYPRLYNRSIGYVKGLFKLWDNFGTSINNPKQKKDIYKYCKYLIQEMPGIDNFNTTEKEYRTLDDIVNPMCQDSCRNKFRILHVEKIRTYKTEET